MLPEYKKKAKKINEQNNNINAVIQRVSINETDINNLTQTISNLQKAVNAIQKSYKTISTGNANGVLIKCVRTNHYDKYAIKIIGASNASATPVDTVIRLNHTNTMFNGTILNNGVALSGITYKLIDNVGYIHIPIVAYSTLQVESCREVELTLTNAVMPS